jgi:hypothetical protein
MKTRAIGGACHIYRWRRLYRHASLVAALVTSVGNHLFWQMCNVRSFAHVNDPRMTHILRHQPSSLPLCGLIERFKLRRWLYSVKSGHHDTEIIWLLWIWFIGSILPRKFKCRHLKMNYSVTTPYSLKASEYTCNS